MTAKRLTMEEAAELVPTGSMLALGGMTLYRRPVAFVRALINRYRQQGEPCDLTLLAFTGGFTFAAMTAWLDKLKNRLRLMIERDGYQWVHTALAVLIGWYCLVLWFDRYNLMLALAVGSFFFGFVGLLLAMPAAVLIKLLLREGLARYRESDAFRKADEASGAD